MKPLCIYHSVDGTNHCDDGFAAAWVVNHAKPGAYDFHPGVYQRPPPDVTGRDVLMVDFSYKRPIIEEMLTKARSITILDHHATAVDELQPLLDSGALLGLFDMDRCGAMLTWRWFMGDRKPPEVLRYIEDRDLWRKALPDGDAVTFAVRSFAKDFATWDELMSLPADALKAQGRSIHRYYRVVVEALKAHVYRENIGGHNVPTVNCPMMFASEVAGEIADPETFGACWWQDGSGNRVYSLRSRGGVHVGHFAVQFGGGGHKGAAGFTIGGY